MGNKTIEYYNQNADSFVQGTVSVDFKETQDKFLKALTGKKILDFGCGSGRDTKYFIDAGFDVVAIDGSEELCKCASAYTGIQVKHMLFQNLDDMLRISLHIYGIIEMNQTTFRRKRKGKDTSMTVDRKVSSIEASFKMESMPFDAECRRRVKDVLVKKVSAADAIAELNRKYRVSVQTNERSRV